MPRAQELWLELSRCAAMCYRRGGRRRNAALLRAEVADALAKSGAVRDAVSLLSSLAQEVLLEGWLGLASLLLQRLLACCAPLPPVCMLRLPSFPFLRLFRMHACMHAGLISGSRAPAPTHWPHKLHFVSCSGSIFCKETSVSSTGR